MGWSLGIVKRNVPESRYMDSGLIPTKFQIPPLEISSNTYDMFTLKGSRKFQTVVIFDLNSLGGARTLMLASKRYGNHTCHCLMSLPPPRLSGMDDFVLEFNMS